MNSNDCFKQNVILSEKPMKNTKELLAKCEFALDESAEQQSSKEKKNQEIRNLEKRRKLTRREERKIIQECLRTNFDVDTIALDFENYKGRHIINEIGGFTKRSLKKINKHFQLFDCTKIGRMRDDYLFQVFKFLINKRDFKIGNKIMDFEKMFEVFMFKKNKDLSEYFGNYPNALKITLVRIVEMSEIVDIRYYKEILKYNSRSLKIEYNTIDKQSIYDDPNFFSFSNEQLEVMIEILDKFEDIQKIYKEVIENKDNSYRRQDIIHYFQCFQATMEFIREKMKLLTNGQEEHLFRSVLSEGIRRTDYCIQRFYEAKFIDAIRSMDEIFNDTDKEDEFASE